MLKTTLNDFPPPREPCAPRKEIRSIKVVSKSPPAKRAGSREKLSVCGMSTAFGDFAAGDGRFPGVRSSWRPEFLVLTPSQS